MLANRDHYCPRRLTLSVTRSLRGVTEERARNRSSVLSALLLTGGRQTRPVNRLD